MRLLAGLALLVLVLALGAFAALHVFANEHLRAADERWEQAGTPLDHAPYADAPANAAALALETSAARLGIGLVPRDSNRTYVETTWPVREEADTWLRAELAAATGTASALPAAVRDWLDAHRVDIDAIITEIVTGDEPQWEVRTTPAIAIPNLFGHLTLQRLLTVAALAAAGTGDHERTGRLLEASWRLDDALARRPELVCRLVLIATTCWQTGLLRKLAVVPGGWEDRLAARAPRRLITDGLRFEAWRLREFTRRSQAASVTDSWWHSATRPLHSLYLAGALADLLEAVASDAIRDPCPVDVGALRQEPTLTWFPTTPHTSRIATLTRADRLQLDLEFTLAVVRARRERAPSVATGTCTSWTFRTELRDDASPRVRYEGPPPPEPAIGLVLPLEWVQGGGASVGATLRPPSSRLMVP